MFARKSKTICSTAFILSTFLTGSFSKAGLQEASRNYLLDGDLNGDLRVDFSDFLILAQNWLADCLSEPQNPACHRNVRWLTEPPMFTGRNQFCGGVINGKIYVFGGNDRHGGNLKSTEVYDPNTMQWTYLADNNHNSYEGVEELTSAVVNGKLYVFGAWGWNEWERQSMVINFNEMYNPATDTWTTLRRKPTTVSTAPATVYKDEIYLFGGSFVNSSEIYYRVVECYNPSNNTWRMVTNMPKNLSNMGVTTIGNKAYIFGGYDPATEQLVDDVITYDFETGLWNTDDFTRLPVKMAYCYSGPAPVIDGKVYLICNGEHGGDERVWRWSNRVDIYDPVNNTWETGPSLPMPLDSHTALVIGYKVYLLGGYNNWSFENGPMSGVISLDMRLCSQ